jgi:hypothetical protein
MAPKNPFLASRTALSVSENTVRGGRRQKSARLDGRSIALVIGAAQNRGKQRLTCADFNETTRQTPPP